jgi:hypothetical protein
MAEIRRTDRSEAGEEQRLSLMTQSQPPERKAGLLQVFVTIFCALFAIGKKNTWQKDGATVSLAQIVVGAFVGMAVLVALLIWLVGFVTR